MKKFFHLLLLLLALGSMTAVRAQSGCELYISTDFDSECLITEYIKCSPQLWELGLQDCMLACKGNTVTYSAVCDNVSQYSWFISGADNYHFTNQGRTAVVTWGSGTTGNISVSVLIGDTLTCTAETCVLLMDSPEANSSSVPAYFYENDMKVIEICLGETINFVDMSTAFQTPITGHYWESAFGAASTQNYSLTPLDEGEYGLTHCVRNECGCENCENYLIRVKSKVELELSCYGTVCENTTESYTLINPPCGEYVWNVEGGSLEGQGTPNITVHWGSPASGYGVISLDASNCETECDALLSVQIPVITNQAEISGPEVVCVGEMQIYELPRWGSTEYTWWNNNGTCLELHSSGNPSQYMLEFTHPGVVTIGATYICRYLKCGYLTAAPKTIVIKDTMSILSDRATYCKGQSATFQTTHGNTVLWRVLNQNGQEIYSTNSVSLSYIFQSAGNFIVTAEHADYCKVAEFHVTVLGNPPAITHTEGPSEACPGSSILLSATPTSPNCYLVWQPLSTSQRSISVSGNEVTISYGNEVCDVAVYQVDAEYNCRSEAYIHEVDTFRLLPIGLPAVTATCAGSTVHFSVPDQSENVTYEWTVEPANAASIVGDHLLPSVDILTNHLSNLAPPYSVNVKLKRVYCSNIEVRESVGLLIEDVQNPTTDCPDTVCENESATLAAYGNTSVSNHYTWSFSDTSLILNGTSVTRTFDTPGYVYVTLKYHPSQDCDTATVYDTIWVNSIPYANIIRNGHTLSVQSYQNVTYSWTLDGVGIGSSPTCTAIGEGTYCCTITSTVPPYCYDSDCYLILYDIVDPCLPITLSHTTDCNVATVSADNPLDLQLLWTISTDDNGSYCTPTQLSNSTTAYFNIPGIHQVRAYAVRDGLCYEGIADVTVNCVPKIEVTYDCNGHIVVTDQSQYISGFSIPARTVVIDGTGISATISPSQNSASLPTAGLAFGTYTVTMTIGTTGCVCSKSITLEPHPTITSIDIPSNMCANTPFLFSAIANGSVYEWDFGDGSTNEGNGIYHAYETDVISTYYDVILNVKNQLGCSVSSSKRVYVQANVFDNPSLSTTLLNEVCQGLAREIRFNYQYSSITYTWLPENETNNNFTHNVYQTGDYSVFAYHPLYGCRAEAKCNVGFLNEPWAWIVGDDEYCEGETVKLNGNTGNDNAYVWSITGPANYTFSTANISFVPSLSGTYTAVLTVTNNLSQCSATASHTFTVHPKPAAPSIAFSGNRCIHEPPVEVSSTTSQSLFWNNGFHNSTAYYYTPGFLTAHYFDPTTGCRSYDAQLYIDPAPDYDALLTGCYKMCQEEFQYDLPIWGLYPDSLGYLNWEWIYSPSGVILSGNSINPLLPLIDFGSYTMTASYSPWCVNQSPELVIEQSDVCPCDSVSFKPNNIYCKVSDCKMHYYFNYTVCNNGSQTLTFDDLQTNIGGTVLYANPMPLILPPGGCQNIDFEIEITDFMSSTFEFVLIDDTNNCVASYVEDIDWQSCVNDNCGIFEEDFEFEMGTAHQSSYFHFHFNVANAVSVLDVWSSPSQVISPAYFGSDPVFVDGLLMLDYGLLSQMAQNGESICLYVVACVDGDKLCFDSICVQASTLLEKIPEDMRDLAAANTSENDSTKSLELMPPAEKPYLAPNPTRDEVTVMGIAPENVSEILVLTMEGRQVSSFNSTHRFNVSSLAPSTYIVRVITKDNRVHYLKLVRQ